MKTTPLLFGIGHIKRPNDLIQIMCLSGTFTEDKRVGKTFHPKNILARFGKPRLSYGFNIYSQKYFPNTWIIHIKYNCSVSSQDALRDFSSWLEDVIREY
jgi:hypothetical protein